MSMPKLMYMIIRDYDFHLNVKHRIFSDVVPGVLNFHFHFYFSLHDMELYDANSQSWPIE